MSMCIFKSANERQIAKLTKISDQVELLADRFASMSDEALKGMTAAFKNRLAEGATLDELLPEAYAVVREAAMRVLKMKHYPVQIIGGIALHQGRIAEMCTGEGKTLVSTLPAYLNALTGKGVHIVTVNDYLAKRDAEWMGKIHRFLGLTVGVSVEGMSTEEKREAYKCDIVYATNNSLGFDYLRDNMAISKEQMVQRGLHFAIIDEVDSILIDEARTPLIISGKSDKSSDIYVKVNAFVKTLYRGDPNGEPYYEMDEKENAIRLTETGVEKAERYFGIENLGDIENNDLNHNITIALRAHFMMKRDRDYIVNDHEVIIIDEFTGRLMIGRRFSDGLHQAIEAKEGVRIKDENKTLATITFQNFFRMYPKLSGMTGTAKTEETEFKQIYGLDVVAIPTNEPIRRLDQNDRLYKTRAAKIRAIIEDIKDCYERKQPVLVGTISVEKSEELSDLLKKQRIPHNVLNAKNHEREAEIIAQAGRLGQVTIATNMAGRGTDIMLGGNPDYLARAALENKNYSHEAIVEATGFGQELSEEAVRAKADYDRFYKDYKQQTEAEKAQVLEQGGLRVIGTERHESRRIDNQLRGRSGRQGDVGSSVFYISMEDDIARIFGGERMQSVANALHMDEDTPIEVKILTRSIERAQMTVENRNYSVRKHVLAYDDVMNRQREIIYAERNKVLMEEDVHEEIVKMIPSVVEEYVAQIIDYGKDYVLWDYEKINKEIEDRLLPAGSNVVTKDLASDLSLAKIVKAVAVAAVNAYDDKQDAINAAGLDFGSFERRVMLFEVDRKWIEHIDAMDALRKGIGLRAIGQRDPVISYANEGFEMFDEMIASIQRDIVYRVLKEDRFLVKASPAVRLKGINVNQESKKEPGRNDPCPCGSGKKYKNCCGKNV
ncbi:MAG: preprotein translocase subunit SecA [Clostridia bacterium]|nr:preprotein translocase subunit SecA [Clostridia bacterium]